MSILINQKWNSEMKQLVWQKLSKKYFQENDVDTLAEVPMDRQVYQNIPT
jgi:hypothetical protein